MTMLLRDLELSVRECGCIVIPRECVDNVILKNVDMHYTCTKDNFEVTQANVDYLKMCIKPNPHHTFKNFRMLVMPGEWSLYEMLERTDITHITFCYTDNTRTTYTVAWNEETGDFEGEKRVDLLENEMIQLKVVKTGLNAAKREKGIFILKKGFRQGFRT